MAASIAQAVRLGLSAPRKSLPPFLFYDAQGSALFDKITELPEYYLTRTERVIFERHGHAIMIAASRGASSPLAVLELGAGSASKTQILLRALSLLQGRTHYLPADVSASALEEAASRLRREEPKLDVLPIVGAHSEAFARARSLDGPLLMLFIGSSIGNYGDPEAAELLGQVSLALGSRGVLLLGTDLRKPLDVLLPAYDDAQGVTAAFNRNILARINRELGGRFDIELFRHVALWNEAASCVEMHLESEVEQRVWIEALDRDFTFAKGERIHTESSHKYDQLRVDSLLRAARMVRSQTFTDERGWFGVHLARPS